MKNTIQTNYNAYRIFLCLIGGLLLFLDYLWGYSGACAIPMAWAIMAMSAFLVVAYRKKWELFILFALLAYYNYGIVSAFYISPLTNFFMTYRETVESYICENIVLFYMMTLCMVTPRTITVTRDINVYKAEERHNDILIYGIAAVLCLILVFEFSRPEDNTRGGGTQLYEYSIIFFIVGFLFSSNKKTDTVLITLLLLFTLQNFVYGGRVTGVQLLVVLFLMRYAQKVTFARAIPLGIIFVLVMQFIGSTRGNYTDFENIGDAIISMFEGGSLVNDTAYSAYHTSITFIKTESFGWENRITIFVNFLASMLLGGSKVPDSNLAEFTSRFYKHYYGGVLPIYLHFFLGNAGVIISALVTNFYIKIIADVKKESHILIKGIAVYIVSGISRWYLYSPSNLLRGCMLLSLTYAVFKCAENLILYRKNV